MDNPCLVPTIKGTIHSFCLLSMMLAVGSSYMAFTMFRYIPSIPTLLRVFIINHCQILSNAFSESIDTIMWFYPSFCYVLCHVYRFVNIVPTLHPQNKSHLVMVYNIFSVLLELDC